MKLVRAVIQPAMLDGTLAGLYKIDGLHGVGITEIRCAAAHCGHGDVDINKQVEVMIPDSLVDEVLKAIQQFAHTGRPGDGRIFVLDIERTINIRTGEHSEQ